MSKKVEDEFAEFNVPMAIAAHGSGDWFWDLASWRGVRTAKLSGMYGTVEVTATPTAMKRVRKYCAEQNYKEIVNMQRPVEGEYDKLFIVSIPELHYRIVRVSAANAAVARSRAILDEYDTCQPTEDMFVRTFPPDDHEWLVNET